MAQIGTDGDKVLYFQNATLAGLQAEVIAKYDTDPAYQVWGGVAFDSTVYIQAMVRR